MYFFKKSQTATEYVVIFVVVILVAITAFQIASDYSGIGSGDSKKISDYKLSTGDRTGISRYYFSEGFVLAAIHNNYFESLILDDLTLKGVVCNSTNTFISGTNISAFPLNLNVGQEIVVNCSGDFSFQNNAQTPTFFVNYFGSSGNGAVVENCSTIADEDGDGEGQCGDLDCINSEYCVVKSLRIGLAAYWPMDGNFFDNSSNGQSGTTTLGYVSSPLGQAVNFDGSSYIQTNNGNSFFNEDNFTVSVWINSNSSASAGIIGRANKKFQIFVNASGKVVVKDGIIYNFNSSSYQITLNVWHHIVVVAEGNVLKLYLNGVLVDSKAGYVNTGVESVLRIGVDPDNVGNDLFYKYLDELTIWDRAITVTEVGLLHNGGSGRSIRQ